MTSDFVISVVVPTRNRAHLLGGLVASLEAQRGLGPFELIVVDDASTDQTWPALERLRCETRFPLVTHRLERGRGPAAARNVGWRMGRAPLVAFTDDDCLPQPDWLAHLVAGLHDADLVQGCTVPDPMQAAAAGPFSRSVETTREWGYYETCNIGYRRPALARAGGFDEGFRRPFGEDTDLAWRVKDAGGRSLFEPGALVHHAVWPGSFLGRLRDLPRREGMVRALHRNPHLRARLPRRWFWERSHPPALLAAAGLGVMATRPWSMGRTVLGLALVAPYCRFRTRVQPLGSARSWPLVIPQALVADLAEVGVLAIASARYRTLLL